MVTNKNHTNPSENRNLFSSCPDALNSPTNSKYVIMKYFLDHPPDACSFWILLLGTGLWALVNLYIRYHRLKTWSTSDEKIESPDEAEARKKLRWNHNYVIPSQKNRSHRDASSHTIQVFIALPVTLSGPRSPDSL